MAQYKINRNKKPLTDEQIERHKSFSSLLKTQQELHQYKSLRKPLYKNFKLLSVIIVALTVVLVLVLEYAEQEEQAPSPANKTAPAKDSIQSIPNNDSTSSTPANDSTSSKSESASLVSEDKVQLPANLQLPYLTYQVNAEKGAVLYPGNGARILIPANAFKDAQGNLIKGNVEIKFREFRNSFDFFRGGIPMHWKDGQCLVSNGMFEINGTQNGKQVLIAKEVTVDLLTVKQNEEYQLYYFDQNKKEWLEKGKENKRETFYTSAPSAIVSKRIKKFKNIPREVEVIDVIEPISIFNNLTWELIDPMDPQKLMSLFRTPWSNVSITKLEGDTFTLSLLINEGEKSHTVSLRATLFPIYSQPEQHSEWLKSLYLEYTSRVEEKERDMAASEAVMNRYLNSEEYKETQKWLASPEGKKMQLSGMVYSRFTVNNFGVWNCDHPANLPKGAVVKASFKDQNNNALNIASIYLVDYEMNSMFSYYTSHFNAFEFNPKHNNVAWCVLDENHIGIFTKESFKNVPTSGLYTFVLNSVDVTGMTTDDFNKLFSLPAHVTTSQQIEVQNKVNIPERTISILSKKLYKY